MARKFINKDSKEFWKEIKKVSGNKDFVAETVGGATGSEDIAGMWKNHYDKLLNSCNDHTDKAAVLKRVENVLLKDEYLFTVEDVKECVKHLKKGKSAACDQLQAEHLQYASTRVSVLLSFLFNAIVVHDFIPLSLMDTVLIPIVKDKKGDVTDQDNYRPIAITTVLSKLFESLILVKFTDELNNTTCNQFGFKRNHSTDLCVFTFKQIVEYYISQSSPVYICYLDASKAFDRVNHWVLFMKLLERIPGIFVRLLITWYTLQRFMVRWGNVTSPLFNVSNGVRQGGVLSPILFNIYTDDLSKLLFATNVGCTLNNVNFNHLAYADDMVLLAPSPAALQELLCQCELYAVDHSMIYNVKKTVCMCIKPKMFRDLHVPPVTLNGRSLTFVTTQKYLGVLINNAFNDNDDIKRQTRSIYCAGNILIKKFKHCSDAIKDYLFKTYCTGIYSGHLWYRYNSTIFSRAKTAYNCIFRKFRNLDRKCSISASMVSSHVPTFIEVLRKLATGFIDRLKVSNNVCTQTVYNSLLFHSSPMSQHWLKTVYAL